MRSHNRPAICRAEAASTGSGGMERCGMRGVPGQTLLPPAGFGRGPWPVPRRPAVGPTSDPWLPPIAVEATCWYSAGMNLPLICLIVLLLAGGGLLYWRLNNDFDVWTGKPLPIQVVRRNNPGLRIVQSGGAGLYIVRDASRSLMAYVSFLDGLPAGRVNLFPCGSHLDTVFPAWIPRYPRGRDPVCVEWTDESGPRAGVTFSTDDSPVKVYNFYKVELEKGDWTNGGSSNLLYDRQGREKPYGEASLAQANVDNGRRVTVFIFRWGTEHTVIAISFRREKSRTR